MTLAPASRRKAATLLVALGPERAASVLRGFDDAEVSGLMAEVAGMGALPREDAAAVLREMAEEVVGSRVAATGGPRYASELLTKALGPERATRLMARVSSGADRPFAYLADCDPALAGRALSAEPPASVALALAHLSGDAAAGILVQMAPESAVELARRLASLERAHPDVIARVDADFRARLGPALAEQVQEIPGLSLLVEMLNRASRDEERALLDGIEQEDPDLAERIREALFVFDDVARLDDRSIQQVLKTVDSKDLATALKGASTTVSEAILRNLSERARTNLLEEIEFMKGVPASDIEEARTRVVKAVRTLEEAGTITIERGGEG